MFFFTEIRLRGGFGLQSRGDVAVAKMTRHFRSAMEYFTDAAERFGEQLFRAGEGVRSALPDQSRDPGWGGLQSLALSLLGLVGLAYGLLRLWRRLDAANRLGCAMMFLAVVCAGLLFKLLGPLLDAAVCRVYFATDLSPLSCK